MHFSWTKAHRHRRAPRGPLATIHFAPPSTSMDARVRMRVAEFGTPHRAFAGRIRFDQPRGKRTPSVPCLPWSKARDSCGAQSLTHQTC